MKKNNLKVPISEIFTSIQGEGIYLGVPQIFIRFKDCNLNCWYCDTPKQKFLGDFTPQQLKLRIQNINGKTRQFHSLSLTGGEPLLYSAFLKQFLPLMRNLKLKVYLETNGSLPQRLKEIISFVDIVAMDIKLPSATRNRAFWKKHQTFLKKATKKQVFVKLTVTKDTYLADLKKAAVVVKKVNSRIPVVLQPAFNSRSNWLLRAQGELRKDLFDVRIIPQVHKILGLR